MIDGANIEAGVELRIVLTSEQAAFPAISARVGGTQPTTIIPFMPVMIVAGVIATGLMVEPAGGPVAAAPIEISVASNAPVVASGVTLGLKEVYEQLRMQMASDGLPFLNADELEREIADRKGSRS